VLQATPPLTGLERFPADTYLAGNAPPQQESISTANLEGYVSAAMLSTPNTWSATQTFPAGSLLLSELASQAANTVVGATSIGSPVALALPSCSGAANGLIWTSGTGFGCNTFSYGTGNALFGTVSGNVANDLVTLSNTTVGVQDSGVALSAVLRSAASGSTGSVSAGGTFTILAMTTGHCWKIWAAVLSIAADAGEHLVCYDSGGSFSDVIQGGSGSITFTNTTTALKLNNGFVGAETFQYNVVQVL
jgi:hypothetical protein